MRDLPLDTFGGLRIVSAPSLSDTSEDWSKVRSPGRAKRRRKKHPQKIKQVITPKNEAVIDQHTGTVYVHPKKLAELKAALAREEKMDRAALAGPVVEPDRPPAREMTEQAFAYAHLGIWSPRLKIKRFDDFPEEMGGPEERDKMLAYAKSRARTYGDFHWIMPPEEELSFADMMLSDRGPFSMAETPIAFAFAEIVCGARYKTVLSFASAKDEERFYERFRAIRTRRAREDAEWGTREIKLHPFPTPDFGRYSAALDWRF